MLDPMFWVKTFHYKFWTIIMTNCLNNDIKLILNKMNERLNYMESLIFELHKIDPAKSIVITYQGEEIFVA